MCPLAALEDALIGLLNILAIFAERALHAVGMDTNALAEVVNPLQRLGKIVVS